MNEDTVLYKYTLTTADCVVSMVLCGDCGDVYLRYHYPNAPEDDHGLCECTWRGLG